MDSLFRFFFDYRPVIFQQGEFRLAPSTGSYVAAAIAVAAIAATVLTYRAVAARGRVRDRIVLAVLRMATLALVLFCLFRPVLVVKAAVPQQNFLGVLIDDSRSMQIADWGPGARGAFVKQQFGAGRGAASRRCPNDSCCGRSGSRRPRRASARPTI